MGIGKAHALASEPVQIGRLDLGRAVAAEVTPTDIVAEDDDDIGVVGGAARCRST
jgi:hypothetical protein